MSVEYYNVLEISPLADQDVVDAAYRALCKRHKASEKKLKAIHLAYETIGDPDNREEYDGERIPNGKIIGERYKIVEKIAEGGFGVTYKAEHVISGMPVCVKHAHQVSPQDEAIILEEARSIWDLRHYGLPIMRDLLRLEDGSFALVMSFVEGPTLAQVIEKKKKIDPEHVAWIAERILNALKYLHFHGVVHGDIKPQNVILQPAAHSVTLVDFGLAMICPNARSTSKGYTPFFAAPEQIDGRTLIPESDFYCLALTMIYALGGDVTTLSVPSTTPKAMKKFIKRFLVRDALERPNWGDEDILDTFIDAREADFGRRYSDMKKLEL